MSKAPPLSYQTPIVDPDSGNPNSFFIRLWQSLSDNTNIALSADRTILKYDGAGSPTPSAQDTTFTVTKSTTAGTVEWTVKDSNGNDLTPATTYLTISGDTATMTRPQFEAAIAVHGTQGVRVVVSAVDQGTTYKAQATLTKVQDGASGGGTTGPPGSPGYSIVEIGCYQRASTLPGTPTGGSYDFSTQTLTPPSGWFITPPPGGTTLYMAKGTAYAVGLGGTATPTWAGVGKIADDGSNGLPGLNNALVSIYQRSSAGAPSLPTSTATYVFSTTGLTGLNNGWSSTVPAGTDPLYITEATASSTTSSDTIGPSEWSPVQLLAQSGTNGSNGSNGTNGTNGSNGINAATVHLYQRNTTGSPPAVPSATTTYTFSTAVLSGINNGWAQTVPASSGGKYLFVTTAAAVSTASFVSLTSGQWSTVQVLAQDGSNGSNGADGQAIDLVYVRSTTMPATPGNSVSVPSGWYGDPTSVPGGAGYIWSCVGERATVASNYVWHTPVQLEGTKGVDALTISASPASVTVSCDYNGTPKVSTPTVQLNVFQAGTDVHSVCSYGTPSYSGVGSVSVSSTGVVTATISSDTGYVDIPISYNGAAGSFRITYTKVKDGSAGGAADSYSIPAGTSLGTGYANIHTSSFNAGPNGSFYVSSSIDFTTGSSAGSVQSYFEIVTSGGTFGPYASANSGSVTSFDSGNASASQSIAGSATGLSTFQTVTIRFWAKKTSGTGLAIQSSSSLQTSWA